MAMEKLLVEVYHSFLGTNSFILNVTSLSNCEHDGLHKFSSTFFLGTISGLQFFLVLMLYVWLGIGLVSAGFCCQQVLLVARGQTWCQLQKGQLVESRGTWRSNLSDVFGSRWVLGLILPVQTVETIPGNWQRYHEHKHD